jgi:hypothetical protein
MVPSYAKARAELVMLSQRTQRPDARRAQPLEVSLRGDLEFEQTLYDNQSSWTTCPTIPSICSFEGVSRCPKHQPNIRKLNRN